VAQPAYEDLARSAIEAYASLATATAVDRGIVETFTEANSRLTRQLANFEGNQSSTKKGTQRPQFLQDLCASQ
jgi:phage shock protein A